MLGLLSFSFFSTKFGQMAQTEKLTWQITPQNCGKLPPKTAVDYRKVSL
jgi:hypothetical protein